jgi:hypothetical protein
MMLRITCPISHNINLKMESESGLQIIFKYIFMIIILIAGIVTIIFSILHLDLKFMSIFVGNFIITFVYTCYTIKDNELFMELLLFSTISNTIPSVIIPFTECVINIMIICVINVSLCCMVFIGIIVRYLCPFRQRHVQFTENNTLVQPLIL